MKWVSIKDRVPTTSGKYIVKTNTKLGSNIFETSVVINDNKAKWGCTNQEVTQWIDHNYDGLQYAYDILTSLILMEASDREAIFESVKSLNDFLDINHR